jgi:exosortase/archaeosortase family protein
MHSVALSLKAKTAKLIPKTIVPLLKRTVVFLCLFVIISGIIGPHIISHGLVDKDGFQIYGGAGKALLFGVICLLVMVQRASKQVKLNAWRKSNLIWLFFMILSGAVAWYAINRLIGHSANPTWPLLANAAIISSITFAAGASYGPANVRVLVRTYKRELLNTLVLAIAFYFFLLAVYGLWKVLASTVLHSVSGLLHIVGLKALIIPPRTLLLSRFGINIAEYCSGIESIALFTGLYVLVGVLDWSKLKHNKFIYIFPVALVILFGLNILRVFGLILAGYYINPHIAFSLFHTYAGMVFFILYSALFWSISYKGLLAKPN